ncbi:unnamed protein product [Agarophyton chilense]
MDSCCKRRLRARVQTLEKEMEDPGQRKENEAILQTAQWSQTRRYDTIQEFLEKHPINTLKANNGPLYFRQRATERREELRKHLSKGRARKLPIKQKDRRTEFWNKSLKDPARRVYAMWINNKIPHQHLSQKTMDLVQLKALLQRTGWTEEDAKRAHEGLTDIAGQLQPT